MTAGFQLTLPGFDGPVDELPGMVSARQLTLDEIPLASIPSQFLALTGSGEVDLEIAGEVLAATARLMLMKSIQLLAEPLHDDGEDAVETHRERDPEILAAVPALSARQGTVAYASVGRVGSVPRISGTRSVQSLTDAWKSVLTRETDVRTRATVPAFVRLEAAISRIISRVSRSTGVSFRRLMGRASREDAVMHFLATLELLRRGDVETEQDGLFADIRIKCANADRERTQRAG